MLFYQIKRWKIKQNKVLVEIETECQGATASLKLKSTLADKNLLAPGRLSRRGTKERFFKKTKLFGLLFLIDLLFWDPRV